MSYPIIETNIALVDDHEIMLKVIRSILESHVDWKVVSTLDSAHEFEEAFPKSKWDLLILDQDLADGTGTELCKWAKKVHPATKILILSSHPAALYAQEAKKAGAQGYLEKQDVIMRLYWVVERLLFGEEYFPQAEVTG